MTVGRIFQSGLLAMLLAGASSDAFAIPVSGTVTFDGPVSPAAPASYSAGSTFTTDGYTFEINSGDAAVDFGSGIYATAGCVAATGNSPCSDNGTQALYVFAESVTMSSADSNYTFSITGFDAARAGIATVGFEQPTSLRVHGEYYGGGFFDEDIPVPVPNDVFASQTLSPLFTNLGSVTISFLFVDPPCGDGCAADFALDNLQVQAQLINSGTGPTGVPEPMSLGLLGLGLIGLRWMRRKQRSA